MISSARIRPGDIAYLSVNELSRSTSIMRWIRKVPTSAGQLLPYPAGKDCRPFVCTQVNGEFSSWTPLTSAFRPERLLLLPKWLQNACGYLAGRGVYLYDGACQLEGPTEAFGDASKVETTKRGWRRPHLTPDGLMAILAEQVRQQQFRWKVCVFDSQVPSVRL